MSAYPHIAINGGTLIRKMNGTLYIGDNGASCFFPEIKVKVSNFVCKGTAYQWLGVIYIAKGWSDKEFNIHHFIHEYGHFLQQREFGVFSFLLKIAIKSVFSLCFFPKRHTQRQYEKDATYRGRTFWNNHHKKSTI